MSGSIVYAGGSFRSIGAAARDGIVALDAVTGRVTAWNPKAGAPVMTLAVSGSIVYVGGHFASIGGQARNGIAAIDATSGRAGGWNPDAQPVESGVGALAVAGSTVYAGGTFERIGGQARNGIAALDAASGHAIPLHMLDLSGAFALAVSSSSLYVGGDDGVAAVPITP